MIGAEVEHHQELGIVGRRKINQDQKFGGDDEDGRRYKKADTTGTD